ncbi:NlpC/P60 family protein [Frankia sp. Cj5]|uniref:NlpC/P60 family protein n=1 Tax=Frankia sp. Cj5 TaxID=2880978 RepID=UPI001EF57181|nr:NlpC/P60 family protein [Frankia sp. Cj5]
MAIYNPAQIYGFARGAGFSPDQATTMTAVALAESGGNSDSHNSHGEDSRGLWQINLNAHPQWRDRDLYDPRVNARLAYDVSRQGRDVSAWTSTHHGTDAKYLDYKAHAQRAAIEAGDGPGLGVWTGTQGYGHRLAAGDNTDDSAGGAHGAAHGTGHDAGYDSGHSFADAAGHTGVTGGTGAESEAARRFLDAALRQAGDHYVLGAEVNLDDPDPAAFDCSELTQWAAHQAGHDIPDGAWAQYSALRGEGMEIPVEQALRTPGALLFQFSDDAGRGPGEPASAHVAISLGDGRTIEARNPREGVGVFNDAGRWMTRAALVPGISAGTTAGGSPLAPGTAALAGSAATFGGGRGGTDSDADSLTDALEAQLGTDPAKVDSDDDGLSDAYEILRLHTSPLSADTDGDGIADSIELALGTNPGDPDTAHTGRLDGATGDAATTDSDGDGLTDALERVLGSGPDNADTDGDGVADGAEYREHLNLLDPSDLHGLHGLHGLPDPLTGSGTAHVGALAGTHPGNPLPGPSGAQLSDHLDSRHLDDHSAPGTETDLPGDTGPHLPAL